MKSALGGGLRRFGWPGAAILLITILAAAQLRLQGRRWICECGAVWLWSGDVTSANNSQHLFDPYSFTHMLHGVLFWAAIARAGRPRRPEWQLWLALALEALWEVVENTEFVIQRYREATLALGYQGDTIVNSLGDLAACGLGFALARRLGWRRSLALFLITEVVLALWIRDSLILNIIMLLFPIDAIKQWQMGGG